ncbi:YajQ family cyclic di-GMP-binding protein [bacterium]|nr:MAG: YajQ family cyclic di-GMP-binding protein [bacterium]
MASFDIVSRVDLQEVDNAVNMTRKGILTRFDFRESKTEITLDKQEKKIHLLTEDEMKMRSVQDALLEHLVRRKVDVKSLEPKEIQMASQGMVQREFAIKEGVDTDTARTIVKLIKEQKLKVQAAIQDNQVRVSGKKIDDLQAVIQLVRGAKLPIPLQFINMVR